MPVLWTRQSFHNRNNPGVDLTPGLLHKYMIVSITQGHTERPMKVKQGTVNAKTTAPCVISSGGRSQKQLAVPSACYCNSLIGMI